MRRISVVFLALVLTLAVSACGGKSDKKGAQTAPAATAKPVPPAAPLTGLPDESGASRQRCAVTVKIDNTQSGQPKYGVDQADVVYEEVVEGGITRLAAMFNSNAPDRVGPVRSVRLTDQTLVWPIGGVFVYSGGAKYAVDSIDTAPVVQLDETRAGDLMFRDRSRNAPFNLYANVSGIYSKCGPKVPPPPLFAYRTGGAGGSGNPAAAVRVGFQSGFAVTWTWDAASGSWQRQIFGKPETVAGGGQLAVKNVVVMTADYTVLRESDSFGAEAQLTGQGPLQVFTDGKVITGTWTRPTKEQPAQLRDATGLEIKLTPGSTWVELPAPDYAIDVTAPPAPTTPAS